jgi:hypothetical protein
MAFGGMLCLHEVVRQMRNVLLVAGFRGVWGLAPSPPQVSEDRRGYYRLPPVAPAVVVKKRRLYLTAGQTAHAPRIVTWQVANPVDQR